MKASRASPWIVSQKGLTFMQERQATSTSNTLYDLVSTLYHELQQEQMCEAYILSTITQLFGYCLCLVSRPYPKFVP